MAEREITIMLPEDQIADIVALVEGGGATSLAAFVRQAVAGALDDIDQWNRELHEALLATGGPLTEEERQWADELLQAGGASPEDDPPSR